MNEFAIYILLKLSQVDYDLRFAMTPDDNGVVYSYSGLNILFEPSDIKEIKEEPFYLGNSVFHRSLLEMIRKMEKLLETGREE